MNEKIKNTKTTFMGSDFFFLSIEQAYFYRKYRLNHFKERIFTLQMLFFVVFLILYFFCLSASISACYNAF